MAKADCIFCNCLTDPQDIILYQNDFTFVRLDRAPVNPGHMEVIPKKHFSELVQIDDKTWLAILDCIKHAQEIAQSYDFKSAYEKYLKHPVSPNFVKFIKKVLASPYLNKSPDAFTIGVNDGDAAGISIHHTHIHVIPRYWGDVPEPRGGIRAIFGNGSY